MKPRVMPVEYQPTEFAFFEKRLNANTIRHNVEKWNFGKQGMESTDVAMRMTDFAIVAPEGTPPPADLPN